MPEEPLPTEEQVRGYLEACSNWGRWGDDDSAGTVNLVTPEKRREAAALVRTGRAVSLARRLNTQGGPGNWNPAQHYLQVGPQFSADYLGMFFHGYATTHIDALCHIFCVTDICILWDSDCVTRPSGQSSIYVCDRRKFDFLWKSCGNHVRHYLRIY